MKRICNRKLNHKGFSLIEVLIAVAILAIVSLPILKAFSTSAMVNRNARRQENANTAASAITEQFKSMTVGSLVEKYGDTTKYGFGEKVTGDGESGDGSYTNKAYEYDADTGRYTFYVTSRDKSYYEGINGEEFYVEVELNPKQYENQYDLSGNLITDNDNPSNNINSYDMPKFSDINSKENYVVRDILYKYDNDAKGNFIAQINSLNASSGANNVFASDKVIKSIEILNKVTIDESTYTEAGEEAFIQTVTLVIRYEYSGLNMIERTENLGENRFKVKRTGNGSGDEVYVVGNTEPVYDDINKNYGSMKNIYLFYMPYKADTVTMANDKITIRCDYETGAAGDGKSIIYENIDTYIVEQNIENMAKDKICLQKENVSLYINNTKVTFDTDGRTTDLPAGANKGPVSIYSNIKDWNEYNKPYKESGDEAGRNNGITVNSPEGKEKYLYTINVKVWLDRESMEQGEEPLADMTSTKEN